MRSIPSNAAAGRPLFPTVTGAGVLGGRYVLQEVLGTGGMATV
jgi:hypothetical protein